MSFSNEINWKDEIPFIKTKGLEGWTMPKFAEYYGVTRQRIHQIIKDNIPNWKQEYGKSVKKREYDKRYFAKWGKKDDTDLYSAQRAKFRQKKANSYGYEWTIEFGELEWPEICPILGIPINYFAESREEGSCSFDRIDNSQGYVTGNVQVISWRANRIKNDGTSDEHRKIANYLDTLNNITI